MELLQLLQVSSVHSPCLTSIEKARQYNSLVHLELRGQLDVVLVQDTSSKATESLTGLADSGVDLLI